MKEGNVREKRGRKAGRKEVKNEEWRINRIELGRGRKKGGGGSWEELDRVERASEGLKRSWEEEP